MLDKIGQEVKIGDEVEISETSVYNPAGWENGEKCTVSRIHESSYGKGHYAVLRKKCDPNQIAIFFSHEFQKI